MGAIGGRLATIARGIGMNVLGWSALGEEARIRKTGAKPASKEEILSTADVVSLHVRLTPETRNFLGRKELAMMKPTAILVNTGRGALVDREALLVALQERRLLGAGLDVFHQEPLAADDPILTPAQRGASRPTTRARHPRSSATGSSPRWPISRTISRASRAT